MRFNNPFFKGGDAFVLFHENKYYLYCTRENDEPYNPANGYPTAWNGRDGFEVYVSEDMQSWKNMGYCLEKGFGVIGEKWFWAPEVSFYQGKFYMVYATDEHIAIAVSASPTGPFKQKEIAYLRQPTTIDPHLFFDDDKKIYIYYVSVGTSLGNHILMAEMKPDLSGIAHEHDDILICADDPWETIDCKVAEGPFVLKHKGLYYLTYSANHVRSRDYAIGYAVSDSPAGPFKKVEHNPILIGKGPLYGYGHHSFVRDRDGSLICVYHCHNPYGENFKPRYVCFSEAAFIPVADGSPDRLSVF